MNGMTFKERLLHNPTARQLREEVLNAPLEPILHASILRLKWLGAFSLIGHPLFYWIWHFWLPQPYENLGVRLGISASGGLLMLNWFAAQPSQARTQHLFNAICFIQLPLFFSWMYLMNDRNAVWLASLSAVVLIYFHLTDWRIAAAGCVAGFAAGTALAMASGMKVGVQPETHLVVLAFAWFAGLMLGISGANLRRERLNHSLATIGIMAHELRTPLSTAGLIADALLNEARRSPEAARAGKLEKLGQRLNVLTRSMNHHIDMQIANARLLQLAHYQNRISAAELVADTVAAYPFRSTKESECAEVIVHRDFVFRGARAQFAGVLDNLIQNALRSLQAAGSLLNPGDLRIEVGSRGQEGRITISDRGIGIDAAVLQRVFEPFFSSDHGTGHGLGLAFCRRVVAASKGTIQVKSEIAAGAVFTITLPLDGQEHRSSTKGERA
ncbi:MAG TPA: HAMP domain-containing sensor histidine kinase [Burkholderiaceae bacterium]|nr:HAMP domain-containing sensor histidine kinase [Burkholderiaceae bacterium]